MSSYKLDDEKLQKIKDDLANSQKSLEQKLKEKNKLALLEMEKSNLITENDHFKKYDKQDRVELSRSLSRHSADKIMSVLLEYNMLMEEHGCIKFLYKLKFLLTHSIWNFKFYDNSPEVIEKYLEQLYYKLKLAELNKEIQSLENKLNRYNFDNEMKKYSENSMTLLKHTLYKKFNKSKNRNIFNENILWRKFDSFIKEYPVILSTTHSLRKCASENYLFDRIRYKYRYLILAGFISIEFNKETLEPLFIEAEKIVEKELEFDDTKVKVILYNKIQNKENNGVDFIVNNRLIVEKEKGSDINWNKRIRAKGHTYTNFSAEVMIESDNIKSLGINASHNKINYNTVAFQKIINFMHDVIENNRIAYSKSSISVQIEVEKRLKNKLDVGKYGDIIKSIIIPSKTICLIKYGSRILNNIR